MIGHNALGLPFQNKMLIGRKSPEAFIQHLLDTVCSHDAKAITELYLEDGVLLGTLAETIKTGRQEIRSYFDFFVEKKPCGVITSISSATYNDIAVVNGTYTFDVEGEKVPARFTFVLKNVGHNWMIDTLHSSVQP